MSAKNKKSENFSYFKKRQMWISC